MMKRTRMAGVSLVAVLVVIVVVAVLSAGLVSLTSNLWQSTPATLTSAQSFYSAESGLAIANKQQAGTGAPVSFQDGSITTTKVGDTYTSTVSAGGKTVRVLTSTMTPPGGGAGPLDSAASAATATTGSFTDPNAGTITGGAKKIVMKLVNAGAADLRIVSFSLSCDASQPKLKELKLRTSANGWSANRVWRVSAGVALPTGTINLDQGDPAQDWTIPAGAYVIVDELSFKADVNPGTFTLTVDFQGGQSSAVTFTIP